MLQQSVPQQITEVSGKNGVDAFQLPPNSSALLLDTTAPRVWSVKTDGAGYKTSVPWRISPEESEEEKQYKSLEERIAKIEEKLNESDTKSVAGKSE